MSERADVKFQGNAPTRCPYCHDAVDRAADAWVACEACLARHHAACWSETGACGACHETACVVPAGVTLEAPVARPPSSRHATHKGEEPLDPEIAVHELAVQGDPPVWLAAEPSLCVLARDRDAVEPIALRVRNGTDRPQRIELAQPPSATSSWITSDGAGATAGPGETVTLRLLARVADGRATSDTANDDDRPLHPAANGLGGRVSGTIHVRCGEVTRLVPLDVVRPYTAAALRVWAALFSLFLLGPVVYFHARSKSKPVTRGPAETQASWLLRQRVAVESARHVAIVGPVVLAWALLVAAAIVLLLVAR
jgi:hypothetical protein